MMGKWNRQSAFFLRVGDVGIVTEKAEGEHLGSSTPASRKADSPTRIWGLGSTILHMDFAVKVCLLVTSEAAPVKTRP